MCHIQLFSFLSFIALQVVGELHDFILVFADIGDLLLAGAISEFIGVYHLNGKSGWNGMLVMVQDFPGVAFRQARDSRG